MQSTTETVADYLAGLPQERRQATGKRYDVGKSCVRFKTVDDLPLDLIGDTIASMEVEESIALTEAVHSRRKSSTGKRS
jgi:hypothetical protein